MSERQSPFLFGLIALLCPAFAFAYVGPGAGIGLVGALGGLIIAVIIAVAILLIWPIRMMLRKKKAAAKQEPEAGTESPQSAD